MRFNGDLDFRVMELTWAEIQLRRAAEAVTPRLAPQSAKKIRSALKSVQGALRNARAHASMREEGK